MHASSCWAISSLFPNEGTLSCSHFELLMSLRHSYSNVKLSQSRTANSDSAWVNFYIFQHGDIYEGQHWIFVPYRWTLYCLCMKPSLIIKLMYLCVILLYMHAQLSPILHENRNSSWFLQWLYQKWLTCQSCMLIMITSVVCLLILIFLIKLYMCSI